MSHAKIEPCHLLYCLEMASLLCVNTTLQIVTKRIKLQGMIVGDYHSDKELISAFRADMAQYVQEGKVKVREHLTEGIENAGKAFIEVGLQHSLAVSAHCVQPQAVVLLRWYRRCSSIGTSVLW
jgi:hypothetical protein